MAISIPSVPATIPTALASKALVGLSDVPNTSGYILLDEQSGFTGSNPTADTAAFNAAVATGKVVLLSARTYTFNGVVTPPGNMALRVRGVAFADDGTSYVTKINFTHAGYMLRPNAGYDIRGVWGNGTNTLGQIFIGSSSGQSGMTKLEDIYITNVDKGIWFGDGYQHPAGLNYNRIWMQGYLTCGMNIGGNVTPTGGESNWTIRQIFITEGTQEPINYTTTQTNNSPNSTTDTVNWTGTATEFGFLILRSANGTSGWTVVPNFNNWVMGNTFQATKNGGETWFYKAVRMTVGIAMYRGKEVTFESVQSEGCGVGCYLEDMSAVQINSFYCEGASATRQRFASIWPFKTSWTLGCASIQNGSYGLFLSLSRTTISGVVTSGPTDIAAIGIFDYAGTGSRTIFDGGILDWYSSPNGILAVNGNNAHSYSKMEYDQTNTSIQKFVNGNGTAKWSVMYRSTETGAIRDNNGVSEAYVNRVQFRTLPPNATNDAGALAAGVPIGGTYRNGSVLMVRVGS